MLFTYRLLTAFAAPILSLLLLCRLRKGKEDKARLNERKGVTEAARPEGKLIWIHAASVGEAQSA
ncbi:MAG: glycosyltransferase N-terminal domain-containing protein, partial [Pseudomonadota bacterium]